MQERRSTFAQQGEEGAEARREAIRRTAARFGIDEWLQLPQVTATSPSRGSRAAKSARRALLPSQETRRSREPETHRTVEVRCDRREAVRTSPE